MSCKDQANKSIGCTVEKCIYHCHESDNCTLDRIMVGTHESNPTECQCVDCQSFVAKG